MVAEIETHESQDDSKNSSKDRQLTMGRKKFNMDPKKGMSNLMISVKVFVTVIDCDRYRIPCRTSTTEDGPKGCRTIFIQRRRT